MLRELRHDNPIARLRLDWIFFNIGEDRRLEDERRKDEIEYGGFFANPEVYFKLKGLDAKEKAAEAEAPEGGYVLDDSEYWRKRAAGERGEMPEVKPRRADIAELVRRKREEPSQQRRQQIERQPMDASDDLDDTLDNDDLIIER